MISHSDVGEGGVAMNCDFFFPEHPVLSVFIVLSIAMRNDSISHQVPIYFRPKVHI